MAYMAYLDFRRDRKFSEAKCAIATSFHWWNCKHFSPSQHHSIDDLQAVQVTALAKQGQRRRQMPQMPVETSTFFWNFKATFDHWCLHWFTIDSRRYRSRCCSRTRRDTFFSRRVESLNSGVWFCCHAPASGHIIFAIQGRPVSDSVTWFLCCHVSGTKAEALQREAKFISGWSRSFWPMEFSFQRRCWKISMEFHGGSEFKPNCQKDREREPGRSEFAWSWALFSQSNQSNHVKVAAAGEEGCSSLW